MGGFPVVLCFNVRIVGGCGIHPVWISGCDGISLFGVLRKPPRSLRDWRCSLCYVSPLASRQPLISGDRAGRSKPSIDFPMQPVPCLNRIHPAFWMRNHKMNPVSVVVLKPTAFVQQSACFSILAVARRFGKKWRGERGMSLFPFFPSSTQGGDGAPNRVSHRRQTAWAGPLRWVAGSKPAS
ncbi:hypothetical protein L209DRAFT_71067 [Thermothelomyces heterothallicus CBS 203.75]